MKLKCTDPFREAMENGNTVNIHGEDFIIDDVLIVAVTEAYLAYQDKEDATGFSWKALPWHRIIEVAWVSPDWVDSDWVDREK